MNVFLKVPSRLGRPDGAQFIHRGPKKLDNVLFDLFPQAGVFQSFQKPRLVNVGKSAAQRTLDNVVVNHVTLGWSGKSSKERGRSASRLGPSITGRVAVMGSDNRLWRL
jgi:hypothetical protein